MRVIVGNRNGSQIGEQSNEHNQFSADDFAEDTDGGRQIDFQVQTQRNSVLDVCLHSLENLASSLDGQHDRGETGGKEDDIGGGLSSFRGSLDGDAAISFLEGWSIIDTWK